MIQSDIYNQLHGNAGVAALVSDRIFYGLDTGTVKPSIIIETARQMDGALNKSDLQKYTAVITCVANDFATAQSVGQAVYAAMNRTSFGSVKSCLLSEANETAISDSGDADRIYYIQNLNFSILSGE